ncbi:MAG TPA: HEAT repeat domain-containing protein, partial [bacterium]|nr:HEAT repeat domain-containing protein [bacterium]
PDPSADRVLIEAVQNSSGMMRIGMINSLANRKAKDATSLIASLLKNEDMQTAEAAAFALGCIGGEQGVEAVSAALRDAQGSLRLACSQALLQCADQFAAQGQDDKAKEIYTRMYAKESEPVIRARAFGSLLSMTKDLNLMMQALGDADPKVQGRASQIGVEMPGSKATARLSALLGKSTPETRSLLLRVLGDRGDRTALKKVRRWSQDENPVVRLAALEAVGKLGDAGCVPLFAKRLASADVDERNVIRKSLDGLSGDRVNRAIIRQLPKSKPKAQVELIQSLTVRDATESASLLLKMTDSPDRKVRVEAFKALSELGSTDDIPALSERVLHCDESDSKEAESALVRLVRRLGHQSSIGAVLQERFIREQEAGVRVSLIRLIGAMGDPGSLDTLRDATKDRDESVRYEAIRALAAWPTSDPIDTLLELAKSADKETHQVIALRGFIDQI